ncbi:MAG: hypothetical protein QM330_04625 [Acidobacteriota bacterium]|jgi:hypothetical protein|nr:hypothetical protein [Acidobacteriota bacterium]NLT33365.1 hypothetical protein [Acidobacteriota bacterium]
MRLKSIIAAGFAATMLLGGIARADQIVLRDGTAYSGKFIRGDARTIEFRVLGRVELFQVTDVERITFEEPETVSTQAQVPEAGAAAGRIDGQAAEAEVLPPAKTGRMAKRARVPAVTAAEEIVFPEGTPVIVRTTSAIDTDRNRVGDVFEAVLEDPLVSGDRTVAPRGSLVKGRIAFARESGKLTGRSELVLELTDLVIDGRSHILDTSDYTEVGASRGNRTAATVGGTAALGAVIGAIAGGGRGAAIGAASGAAVGTGVQVITKGETLKIPAETILEFRLRSPLTFAR